MENGKAPSQSTDQQQAVSKVPGIKTEPFILIYDRHIEAIQVICDELAKFGRQVAGTEDHIALGLLAAKHKVDFIIIGRELAEKQRLETVEAVSKINPRLPVYLLQQVPDPSPYDLVTFTNRKAVEWKIAHAGSGGAAPEAT